MLMTIDDAVQTGMTFAFHAARQPDVTAIVSPFGNARTPSSTAIESSATRAARPSKDEDGYIAAVIGPVRRGICAANRGGIRFTPINYHLKGEEIGYIVDNCKKAFIADASIGESPLEAARSAPTSNSHWRLAVTFLDSTRTTTWSIVTLRMTSTIRASALDALYVQMGRPKGVHRKEREPVNRYGKAPRELSAGRR
jgi:long-chain acyl-CoA synthetase